ncbi:3-hydroxyacyl-CoA dehydrogenase family protein [Nocardia australiensis]|uniref:3-hydroxyacyl-CoA dehydrogenase family protein n=1 Tax=Nocardia australiensis TaxID=2887191 RepID=UPI001D142316|nr:3-hydroxyacyl-CoA dehydrogenase NAD-binding domain-containing protein [Nocardia australiensis]
MKNIAILGGGGLMGHGIAVACLAASDTQVTIVSRRDESVKSGLDAVENGKYGLRRAVARSRMTAEAAEEALSRLHGTTDYSEGLGEADLIFESIPEVPKLKLAALEAVGAAAPAHAAVATNTSSIMIAELCSALPDPSRLIGTHWFYPSNVMPLVEVAESALTAPEVTTQVVDFLTSIGKRPVRVKDAPGFFMTRFVNNFIAEAIRAVELGITGPAEVDEMVRTGLGWPMGVFELLDDTASFDAWYHAQEYLQEMCGERYQVPPLARQVFAAGYLGDKTFKPTSRGGWYDFLGVSRDKGSEA